MESQNVPVEEFFFKSEKEENDSTRGSVLGNGLNSSLMTIQKKIVEGNLIKPDRGELPKVSTSMSVLENVYSLTSLETMAVSAKASYAGISGSASYKSSSYYKINNYSVYLFAQKSILYPLEVLVDLDYTAESQEYFQGNPLSFYKKFGDSYMSGLTRGGYYIMMYEFKTSTEESKKSIAAKLRASAKMYNAKANADYQKKVEEIKTFENTQIVQEGFLEGHPTPNLDLADLMAFMNNYNTYVDYDKKNTIMFYDHEDLRMLPYFDDNLLDPNLIQKLLNLDGQLDNNLANLTDWMSDIQYVKNHPEEFDEQNKEKSEEDFETVSSRIKELEQIRYNLQRKEEFLDVLKYFSDMDYTCQPVEYKRKEIVKPPSARSPRSRGPWTKLPGGGWTKLPKIRF